MGVVLAGGAGSRVGGADKGLLAVDGRPLVEHVLQHLRPQCGPALIVANRNQVEYAHLAPVIHDEGEGHAGPLAGLVATFAFMAANRHAPLRALLTVPVDCPDPPRDLALRLQTALDRNPDRTCAFVQYAGAAQPLFALYRVGDDPVAWLACARDALHAHGSVRQWQTAMRALAVDFDDAELAFHNLNTPADFRDYARSHDID